MTKKKERAELRQLKLEARRPKVHAAATSRTATDCNSSETVSENSDNVSSLSSDDFHLSSTKRKAKKKETGVTDSSKLFIANLTSAMDRNKTSDHEAVRLMVPIAAALGYDLSTLPLARSTIQRVM